MYGLAGIEYLPYGTNWDAFSHQLECSEGVQAEVISGKGTDLTVQCRTGDEIATMTFPIIGYPGYHVIDNEGISYQWESSENNLIQVVLKRNFDGKIYLKFEQPWFGIVAEGVSVLAFVGTLWEYRRIKKSGRRKENNVI